MRVVSIQTGVMGHGTYARMMRAYFAQSSDSSFEGYWVHEDREVWTRVINRLLSYKAPGKWSDRQNIDLRRFRSEMGHSLLGKRQAERHLQKATVLHFHTQTCAFLSAGLMRKVPTVLTGDMTAVQISQETTSPAFRWTHTPNRIMDGTVFRAAKRIVLWSEWAAHSVINDYGIDARKVSVIPPGVDLTAITPLHNNRQIDQQSVPPLKLLFVGSDFKRKGGYDVLNVFLEEFADQAELHLVTGADIVCNHPHVFIHRGVAAYSDLWRQLYQQADVFVLPTYHEAYGLVFAEAMAAGLPVIASNINAIPEIVIDGITGFLIQPGNRSQLAERLRRIMADIPLRYSMGERGRAIALQKFDAYKNFQKLEEVFRRLSNLADQD